MSLKNNFFHLISVIVRSQRLLELF